MAVLEAATVSLCQEWCNYCNELLAGFVGSAALFVLWRKQNKSVALEEGGGGGLLLAWPSLPKAHVQKEEAQALLMTALLPALRLRLQAAAFGEFNLDKASARAAWM